LYLGDLVRGGKTENDDAIIASKAANFLKIILKPIEASFFEPRFHKARGVYGELG
jgi:hypothetical protein